MFESLKSNMSMFTSNERKKLKVEIHPLLIDVIAHNIFQYLSLNEILECRAVCKLWLDAGTSRLVSRINDVVIDPPMTKTYGASIWNQFLDMTKQCTFAFTNFALHNFPIGASETIQLFKVCGSTIKTLRLSRVSVNSAQFSCLLKDLPFLEFLEILNLPDDVITNSIFPDEPPELELKKLILHLEYGKSYDRNFLRDLFKSCKKLLSFEISSNYESNHAEYNIIEILIAERSTIQMQELTLSSVDGRLLGLIESHFKLSPLTKFSIGNKLLLSLEGSELQRFITDHKDTWKYIRFGVNDFESIFKFPEMKNLEFLEMGTDYPRSFSNGHLGFDAFNYGTQFPNLVTLKLYDAGSKFGLKRHFNLDELFPETSTVVTSVKNLELPPELSGEVLRRIGKIFPNVLKLNLRFQRYEVISELWITWPLLKTLAISVFENEESSTSIDSIFTGISDESLENWKKSKDELDMEAFRTRPSICLLKHLRHLMIYDGRCLGQWENWIPRSTFTDATAVLSFSKMKELVCLNIPKNVHQITHDCVQDLCKQLNLLEIECPISLYLVKYEWQKKVSTINRCLYQSFPEYSLNI